MVPNQFRFWLGASVAEVREAYSEHRDAPHYKWAIQQGNVQTAFRELATSASIEIPVEGLFFVSQSKTGEPRTFMAKVGGRGKLHIKEHKD